MSRFITTAVLDTHKSLKLRFSYSRWLAKLLRTKEKKLFGTNYDLRRPLFNVTDFIWYFPLSKLRSNLPTFCEQLFQHWKKDYTFVQKFKDRYRDNQGWWCMGAFAPPKLKLLCTRYREVFAFHLQKSNFNRALWAKTPNCTPQTIFFATPLEIISYYRN